jgi:hypothetical protein
LPDTLAFLTTDKYDTNNFSVSSSGMTSGINSKDELFNKILDDWKLRGIGMSKDSIDTEGNYLIQVL